MAANNDATRMEEWQDSRRKRLIAKLTFPIFYLLNRPSMHWFAKAAYDFALRCNGCATTFKGRQGLTVGEENFLRKHLSGRRGGVLFDVGANHGAYTRVLQALVPDADVYAFEPHPATFAQLKQASIGPRTTIVNKALSDVPGELKLFDLANHDGSTQASLSRDAVALFSERVVEHAVTVTTLDAFIEEHGIAYIDLLKVDTEGFDLNVLKGAADALQAGRIGTIQFEFIPANIITGTRMRDFIDVLSTHTIHRLCLNGGLLPLAPYDVKRVEVYVVQNLIALPKSKQPRHPEARPSATPCPRS